MANSQRGQVPVTIGGKRLVLMFSIDAICALEDRLESTYRLISERLAADDSVGFLRTLLWGSLLEHHAGEYDERAAGELMRQKGAAGLNAKVLEAWFLAGPEPEEEAKAPGNPRKRPATAARGGTGRSSSASGAS